MAHLTVFKVKANVVDIRLERGMTTDIVLRLKKELLDSGFMSAGKSKAFPSSSKITIKLSVLPRTLPIEFFRIKAGFDLWLDNLKKW